MSMQTIEVNGVLLHYAVYGSGKPIVVEGARHGDYIDGSKIMGELLLEFL